MGNRKLSEIVKAVLIMVAMLMLVACGHQTITKPDTQDNIKKDAGDTGMEGGDSRHSFDSGRTITSETEADKKRKAEAAIAREAFINTDIHFYYDDASLTEEAQAILREKANWLHSNSEVSVIIEGHCDERGTVEYNLALGDQRANAARRFIIDMGISSSRMDTVSYGEDAPIDKRQLEEAWAKNRRVHFRIVNE